MFGFGMFDMFGSECLGLECLTCLDRNVWVSDLRVWTVRIRMFGFEMFGLECLFGFGMFGFEMFVECFGLQCLWNVWVCMFVECLGLRCLKCWLECRP